MDYEKVKAIATELGFTHVGELDCDTIHLLPEVRKMCEDNTCGMCGKCWSCPPGCGTLEECEARVRAFKHGILVQTGILCSNVRCPKGRKAFGVFLLL